MSLSGDVCAVCVPGVEWTLGDTLVVVVVIVIVIVIMVTCLRTLTIHTCAHYFELGG